MKLLKTLFFILLLLLVLSPYTFAMDMHLEQDRTKSFLSTSGEFAMFTLEEGKISGPSLKVDFNNSFSNRFSIELYLASAINASGGSSFTGIGGYAYYNLFGDCCTAYRRVSIDGKPMISETAEKAQNLQLGFGIDQFFLNGSKSVYSASGVGFGALYQFSLFKYDFNAEARHSQMSAGQSKIQGDFFSLGMVFGL
jgi:hypothetical protein